MSQQKSYSIGDLAQTADVTSRTIRYYVSEGLLPAPTGGGRVAAYSDEHLARLQLIKILKDEYLPLQEIRNLLDDLEHEAVLELLAEKQKSESLASDSAKSYLQTLLSPPADDTPSGLMRHKVTTQKRLKQKKAKTKIEAEDSEHGLDKSPPSPAPTSSPHLTTLAEEKTDIYQDISVETGQGEMLEAAQNLVEVEEETATRWQRIQITSDVELHVKEELKDNNLWQKINQLIKVARQILSSII